MRTIRIDQKTILEIPDSKDPQQEIQSWTEKLQSYRRRMFNSRRYFAE
jgi:hypothetical protein